MALFFLRQRGSRADPTHMIVNMTIGAGSGSSAIMGDKTVLKRAKRLQMPKAVATIYVGNSLGMARYDKLKANEIPNFVNKTNMFR